MELNALPMINHKTKNYSQFKKNNVTYQLNYTCHQDLPNIYDKNYYIYFCGNISQSISNSDNKLAGYQKQKDKFAEIFLSQLEKEQHNKPSNIPNAILIVGGMGTGKTFFVDAMTNCKYCTKKFYNIATEKQTNKENLDSILSKNQQQYKKYGRRSVVIIDNADMMLSDDESNKDNISRIKSYLQDCAKIPDDACSDKYATTFIFITSKPRDISEDILFHPSLKNNIIAFPIASGEDIKEIIKFYIKKQDYNGIINCNDLDYESLCNNLNPDSNKGAYGNDRLSSIAVESVNKAYQSPHTPFEEILNETINCTRRNILPKRLKEYKKDLAYLGKNSLIDAISINASIENGLAYLSDIEYRDNKEQKNTQTDDLSLLQRSNSYTMSLISSINSDTDIKMLQNTKINDTPLCDYWLEIEEGSKSFEYTPRLKDLWFRQILNSEEKTDKLISITLEQLEKSNLLIKTARDSYKTILDEEDDLSAEQKKILENYQNSRLFFLAISNELEPEDAIGFQVNTIKILKQLSYEKEAARKNAENTIFLPLMNTDILYDNSVKSQQIIDYMFKLLAQKMQHQTQEENKKLKQKINDFNYAKNSLDSETMKAIWSNLVKDAKEQFENQTLEDLTYHNIKLLNSMNANITRWNIKDDKLILNAMQNSGLTKIEQKEFVTRYANNKNFRLMLANPNIELADVIDNLLFYEATNKKLMKNILYNNAKCNEDSENSYKNWQANELSKKMSNKFLQIHQEYDINAQGKNIALKLETINTTISTQNEIIRDFTTTFANYTDNIFSLQSAQVVQLTNIATRLASIAENTETSTRHLKALAIGKIAEFEKDKYYKEIASELKNIIQGEEEFNIEEFLLKVDTLVKKEKNSKRRKKLIKAFALIAGVVAGGAALYYFGPEIVSYLTSGTISANSAFSSVAATVNSANIAEKIGSASFINYDIPFGMTEENKNMKEVLKSISPTGRFRDIIKEIEKNPNKDFSLQDIKDMMTNPADRAQLSSIVRDLRNAGITIKS